MNINGIAAVVTGGASGLGEATARALAAKGAKVAIFDRNQEQGEKVAAEIGGIFCEVDVTNDDTVAAGFEKARAAHGLGGAASHGNAGTDTGLCSTPPRPPGVPPFHGDPHEHRLPAPWCDAPR